MACARSNNTLTGDHLAQAYRFINDKGVVTGMSTGPETSRAAQSLMSQIIGRPHMAPAETLPKAQLRRFEAIVCADPDLMHLLTKIRALRLPQWRLVAGCLYQTVWNVLTGRARGTGIKDYDLIYFNGDDLSWAAEDMVIQRVAAETRGCVGPVEVRNQSRVHLWFESRFGSAYPRLSSADEALRRYASVVHAVGVRLEDDDRLDVVAPFGLDDLFSMVIRPNYELDNAVSHSRKAKRAQAIWPEVIALPWGG